MSNFKHRVSFNATPYQWRKLSKIRRLVEKDSGSVFGQVFVSSSNPLHKPKKLIEFFFLTVTQAENIAKAISEERDKL